MPWWQSLRLPTSPPFPPAVVVTPPWSGDGLRLLLARSFVNGPLPLANSTFVSNSTVVAGLLGGEEATSTAALTQIYDRRRWLGWYSCPGSYVMGKHFRHLARSAKYNIDPTLLFEHEGWSICPTFKGIYSGAFMHAVGPLASQLMKKAVKEDCQKIDNRTTEPVNPDDVSLACGLYRQCCGGSPPGDSFLGFDQDLVLLKGDEYVVNAVTRGRSFFRFRSKYACRKVEWCSILLIVQAIAQLVFISHSKLFGQLIFVISLAFSWAHDLWFSSFDKGEVQEAIFQQVLGKPSLIKFVFPNPNRVSAVVFLLLVANNSPRTSGDPRRSKEIVDIFSPSDSQVWEICEESITERLKSRQAL
ncbi:hypothetical protein F5J12DRAFT_948977 [Pisolithus orientalis]|uniref:uncharacterized protein n=1 Tax=Pisolithus orientalis TaxID=936130 RepID=UPI00222510C9|nr:uncharacterized protein F5J12DRAFT_948977 [Pisolithus orientalis]KAI6002299.1 hypothetical protein F5J12DRAFT_948977 [Pisolithus orientalis]